jgi:hypothetical protein
MEKNILKVYLTTFCLGYYLVSAAQMPSYFALLVVDSNSPVNNVNKSPMDADAH